MLEPFLVQSNDLEHEGNALGIEKNSSGFFGVREQHRGETEMDNEIIISALSWTEPEGEVEKIAAGQTRRV